MTALVTSLRALVDAPDSQHDSAVSTLYRETLPRLQPICAKLLMERGFDGVEAEDLAEDAFHEARKGLARNAATLTSDAKVLSYLRSTASNLLAEHVRQCGGAHRTPIDTLTEPCLALTVELFSTTHLVTGRDAIISASYRAALTMLTPPERAVAVAVLEQKHSVESAAALLGLALRTAYRRWGQARTKLERALTPLVGPTLREKPAIPPRPIRLAAPRRMPPVTMNLGPAPLPRR